MKRQRMPVITLGIWRSFIKLNRWNMQEDITAFYRALKKA